MPVMPRIKGKPMKVAYDILGVPPNIKSKRNRRQAFINHRLNYEETSRVR